MPVSYVYALGRVEPRFPRLSVEKEFMQAIGRTNTAALTDRQALHKVLSQRQNRYLARQLCYVLTIEGLETYILQPRHPDDLDLLLDAIRPEPGPADVDVVIGVRGPIAPPEMCNGLMIPIVAVSQMYSFDVDSLIKSIPRETIPEREFIPPAKESEHALEGQSQAPVKESKRTPTDPFEATAKEVFMRIMQMADNAGNTDEHRALNYCACRYPDIYTMTCAYHGKSFSLSAVEVRPSRLSGNRKIMDVICSYTNRQTDVTEKCFCRVDVTEEFPFLVNKIAHYFDR